MTRSWEWGRMGQGQEGDPVDDEVLLDTIGVAFSKMRRRTQSVPVTGPADASDLRRDLLLALIESNDELLNIHAVATALSMERSSASRLVAVWVQQQLLERVASQADGRSITLRLTRQGRDTLARSRHQQREAFDYITADWSKTERMQFARLLHKYAASAESKSQYTDGS